MVIIDQVANEVYMMPGHDAAEDEILIAGDSSTAASHAIAGGNQADGIDARNAAFFRAQKASKADMAVRNFLFLFSRMPSRLLGCRTKRACTRGLTLGSGGERCCAAAR